MISPGLIYLLLSAVLFTVAAVTHFHAASLLLPVLPSLTVIVAILPLISFLNAYIRPNLLLAARASSAAATARLLPAALQTSQAILTTVLATLLLQTAADYPPTLTCQLQDVWQGMYGVHDGRGLRRVQDALDCCGFNTVRDRAYPFGDREASRCAETYGRSEACRDPWIGVMRAMSGVDLGVVLAVGVMQILGLLMMREGVSWWTAWRVFRWDERETAERGYRPLLPARDVDEEETVEAMDEGTRDYGTQVTRDQGPRVEPSPMHERNAWEN